MPATADDLVERILSAAAELSDERIEQLVAEARREAEAEVKGLLKSSIKAALLQRALSRLSGTELPQSDPPPQAAAPPAPASPAPEVRAREARAPEARKNRFTEQPPAEKGFACYVYCLTLGDRLTFSEPVHGVDGGGELNLVRFQDLQAVTSRVPLAEFGQAALAEHAKDPQWLEQKVRAHDQLLKAALAGGPVVPFRFCTLLRSEEDVRQVLERHHERIREALTRLTGKKEWGVKVLLRETVEPPRNDVPSGRWYLERKQNAARKEAENRQQADERARKCHEQLASAAEASAMLPTSTRSGERAVLNTAYLVSDAGERKFHALIAAMDERLEADGLTLEVTGPWPPYNFVNLDLSLPTSP